ncbi:MAG TPA: glycosyltransferase family 4 protein [Thermoleophilaceae bacterium]
MGEIAKPRALVVCPVVPYPPVGGGYKRTLRLLESMQRAGVQPHVLTTDPGQPGAIDALRDLGFDVELLPGESGTIVSRLSQHAHRRPSPFLDSVDHRLRELSTEGAAFVQLEHTLSSYYFDAAGRLPVVLSIHNLDSQMLRSVALGERRFTPAWARAWNRSLAMRAVERRAFPRAYAVVCVSEADAASVNGRARRLLVAPNGVDDAFFSVPPEPPPGEEILFFGQYDYAPNEHGVLRFLRDGWPVLAEARRDARLRLAGKGAGRALEKAVARADRVELVGVVHDMADELARSRVTIVPIWQGGGTRLKVLESLAAARPVAGTSLGVEGVGFRDGEHGVVADDPAELARRAADLLADATQLPAMGRAGRELAERYRWARALDPATQLYRDLATA